MNAWSASQVLASKTMKHRSLYLLLLTLPQLCLEKMKVSYYEKKEETCKSRRNYILNPILLFGILNFLCVLVHQKRTLNSVSHSEVPSGILLHTNEELDSIIFFTCSGFVLDFD